MTTENEWVKLPNPAPKMLPAETGVRFASWCRGERYWVLSEDFTSDAELVYSGQGAEDAFRADNVVSVKLPPGYHFEGSEVVKDCCERYAMAEAGGVAHVCVGATTDNLGDSIDIAGLSFDGRAPKPVDIVLKGRSYTDMPAAMPEPQAKAGDHVKVLMPSITWGDLVNSPLADALAKLLGDGLRTVFGNQEIPYAGVNRPRACACGSTTNVNLRLGVCAACHLEKRKAEVLSDMNRPMREREVKARYPHAWSTPTWEDDT